MWGGRAGASVRHRTIYCENGRCHPGRCRCASRIGRDREDGSKPDVRRCCAQHHRFPWFGLCNQQHHDRHCRESDQDRSPEKVGCPTTESDPLGGLSRKVKMNTPYRGTAGILVLIATSVGAGCDEDRQSTTELFGSTCTVVDPHAARCDSCIMFTQVARLGRDWAGPGYLRNDGNMEFVVRDSIGNYWVGQDGELKRYGSEGRFLGVVGRSGDGPLEFRRPRPIHVDRFGRVHVIDSGNGRISIIDQTSLSLADEFTIPRVSVNSAVVVNDGKEYAIQAWIAATDRIGLPIHVVNDQGFVRSFGMVQSADGKRTPLQHTAGSTERRLTIDDDNATIYAAHRSRYRVEAWSVDGQPVREFDILEELNALSESGRVVSAANPPPQVVLQIHVDTDRLLWVMLAVRANDWADHMVELVAEDGRTHFVPRDGPASVFDIYDSRLDVIDLGQCQVLASQTVDGILGTFLGDGVVSVVDVMDSGGDVLDIWEVSLQR